MSKTEVFQGLGNILIIFSFDFISPRRCYCLVSLWSLSLTFRKQLELFKNIIKILMNFWNNSGIYEPLWTQRKGIYHCSLVKEGSVMLLWCISNNHSPTGCHSHFCCPINKLYNYFSWWILLYCIKISSIPEDQGLGKHFMYVLKSRAVASDNCRALRLIAAIKLIFKTKMIKLSEIYDTSEIKQHCFFKRKPPTFDLLQCFWAYEIREISGKKT